MARRRKRVKLPVLGPKVGEVLQGRAEVQRESREEALAAWDAFAVSLQPLKRRGREPEKAAAYKIKKQIPQSESLTERLAGDVTPVLDLHGLTEQQAHEALLATLELARAAGVRHLRVVTGKGDGRGGVLKRNVPRWLSQGRYGVQRCETAAPEKGGEGALEVWLRREQAGSGGKD